MRVAVVVCVHWMDAETIRDELVNLPIGATVMIGDGQGSEAVVKKIAEEELKLDVEIWPLDTEKYDDRADSYRTNEMLKTSPDLCIAFVTDESKIVNDFVRKSRGSHIETVVVKQQ